MLYKQALSKLYGLALFPSKPRNSLVDMYSLAALFGNPQNKLKVIHVAGTNGKGSVCLKSAEALKAAGYKTGLYTSPHLCCFRERMQINGELIAEQSFARYVQQIWSKIPSEEIKDCGFFNMTTLISFLYFQEQQVDIAVVETGLGGRLDSTNIVDPLVSAITSIGFDHCEILGDTLEKIAYEKAGIMKQGKPVVLGSELPVAYLSQLARENNSKLYAIEQCKNYQDSHNAIFKEIMHVLNTDYNFKITPEAIKYAATCKPKSRLEYVNKGILKAKFHHANSISDVILDVGHNKPALEATMKIVKENHKGQKLKLVVGFASHKDIKENVKVLAAYADEVYFVDSFEAKLTKATTLCELAKDLPGHTRWQVVEEGNIEKTVERVVKESQKSDVVLICGSFYFMCDARKALGYKDYSD